LAINFPADIILIKIFFFMLMSETAAAHPRSKLQGITFKTLMIH